MTLTIKTSPTAFEDSAIDTNTKNKIVVTVADASGITKVQLKGANGTVLKTENVDSTTKKASFDVSDRMVLNIPSRAWRATIAEP